MTKDEAIDVEAERKLFEREMNAQRFFPAELDFTRGKSPSGRDEYVNSHLQSNWNGWLAAKRSIAQPTSEAVAVPVWELFADGWDGVDDLDGDWMQTLPIGTKLYYLPAEAVAEKPQDDRNAASPAALVGCGYESVMGFVAAHLSAQPAADPAQVPAQVAKEVTVEDICKLVCQHTGKRINLRVDEVEQHIDFAHALLGAGVPIPSRGIDRAKRAEWFDRNLFDNVFLLNGGMIPELERSPAGEHVARSAKIAWACWQARGQQAGVPEAPQFRVAVHYVRWMHHGDEPAGDFQVMIMNAAISKGAWSPHTDPGVQVAYANQSEVACNHVANAWGDFFGVGVEYCKDGEAG